ncbi:MAG: hypothetical protein ACP5PP_06115 [Fervidobacterium sp.]
MRNTKIIPNQPIEVASKFLAGDLIVTFNIDYSDIQSDTFTVLLEFTFLPF